MLTQRNQSISGLLSVLLAWAIVLGVFVLTMSRSIGWHDSSELALTAWLPAASHAPGSPLHSLIGHLITTLSGKGFLGTTLLSVVTMTFAAGWLAWILNRLKCNKLVSVTAACLFAFSFQVWAGATVTEVYGLAIMCLAATLISGMHWQQNSSAFAFSAFLFLYGLTLAAYFANILLWPVLALFIYLVSKRSLRAVMLFAFASGLAVLLIAAANYLLARNAFPFGPFIPDTPLKMLMYMTGAQHEPLEARSTAFMLERVIEHTEMFVRSVGYLTVPLALCGIISLDERNRQFGILLAGVFFIYVVYYTIFGSGDYYLMVVPAYFVFALWAGLGTAWLIGLARRSAERLAALSLLLIVVAGLFFYQFDGRRGMATDKNAEKFVADTFEMLPQGAMAVVGWRELTTLVYMQVVEQQREDLRFILPQRTTRHYIHGIVDDYFTAIDVAVCEGSVYTMKQSDELRANYPLESTAEDGNWVRINPRRDCD